MLQAGRQGRVCLRVLIWHWSLVAELLFISLTAGAVQVHELSPQLCKLEALNSFFHCRPRKDELLVFTTQLGGTDGSCMCNSLLSCKNLISYFRPEIPVSEKCYRYITILYAENKQLGWWFWSDKLSNMSQTPTWNLRRPNFCRGRETSCKLPVFFQDPKTVEHSPNIHWGHGKIRVIKNSQAQGVS